MVVFLVVALLAVLIVITLVIVKVVIAAVRVIATIVIVVVVGWVAVNVCFVRKIEIPTPALFHKTKYSISMLHDFVIRYSVNTN